MKILAIAFCLVLIGNSGLAQSRLDYFYITSAYTSFPDTGRSHGHVYDGVLYGTEDHYSDNRVLIIVPHHFHPADHADIIFWFHGWNNNIDSAVVRYGLSRQFAESGVNAVLVLAETAKDAPDSYGGKLEQPETFNRLVSDVLKKLRKERILARHCPVGHVILAGHSGAYRVMAGILEQGNVPVNEVILFDALYAQTEKFLNWISADRDHCFINIFTDHGGTFDESKLMFNEIKNLNLSGNQIEETELSSKIPMGNKILFIHSQHAHNDIIQHPDNFKLFLLASPFLVK